MSWKLIKFGDVLLPPYQLRREDAGQPATAVTRPWQVDTINGAFDRLGSFRGRGEARRLSHGGYFLADNATDLQRQESALMRMMWKRDKLWRRNRDGSEHWVYARLVEATAVEVGTRTHQRYQLVFETTEDTWRGAKRTITASGTTDTPLLPNSGTAAVWDVVLTVTGTSVQQFDVDFTAEERRTKFAFNNLPTTYSTIVLDTGAMTIDNGAGTGLFGGFGLSSAHNHEGWFYLPAGGARIAVGGTAVSGTPTYVFEYWERWV